MLIISDRASNVNRIMRIIERMDESGDADIEVIPLQNASATDTRAHDQLAESGPGGAEAAGAPIKVVADERSNSVLVSGERAPAAAHQGADRPPGHAASRAAATRRCATCAMRTPRRSPPSSRSRSAARQRQARGAAAGAAGAAGGRRRRRQRERGTTIWADTADQRADHHGAAQDHELADGRHRQARHPPRAGAGGGDHRRGRRRQEPRTSGVNWAAASKDGSTHRAGRGFISPGRRQPIVICPTPSPS